MLLLTQQISDSHNFSCADIMNALGRQQKKKSRKAAARKPRGCRINALFLHKSALLQPVWGRISLDSDLNTYRTAQPYQLWGLISVCLYPLLGRRRYRGGCVPMQTAACLQFKSASQVLRAASQGLSQQAGCRCSHRKVFGYLGHYKLLSN